MAGDGWAAHPDGPGTGCAWGTRPWLIGATAWRGLNRKPLAPWATGARVDGAVIRRAVIRGGGLGRWRSRSMARLIRSIPEQGASDNQRLNAPHSAAVHCLDRCLVMPKRHPEPARLNSFSNTPPSRSRLAPKREAQPCRSRQTTVRAQGCGQAIRLDALASWQMASAW